MAAQVTAVDNLIDWFNGLQRWEKEQVVKFLYAGDGEILLDEGLFLGPNPNIIQKGLHCGPIPQMNVRVCPTCGKPM